MHSIAYYTMPYFTILSMLYYTIINHNPLHITIPCRTIHTILYNTISYMPCNTTPYHTTLYHSILHHTLPYHTIPYHTYYTIQYNAIPYYTIRYHTIPYHTMPYPIIPHYTIFYNSTCSFCIFIGRELCVFKIRTHGWRQLMAWSDLANLFRGSSHDFCQIYKNIKQIDLIFYASVL